MLFRSPLPEILDYDIEKPMQVVSIKPVNVELRLKRLNPKKYVGPDGIHPCNLKEAHLEPANPLTKLFQKSPDTKVFPQDW